MKHQATVQGLGQPLAQHAEGGLLHGRFEGDVRFVRTDSGKATAFGQQFQLHQLQQRLHRTRQCSIAIGPDRSRFHQSLLALTFRGGTVGPHLFVGVGDPVSRNEGGDLQIHLGVIH